MDVCCVCGGQLALARGRGTDFEKCPHCGSSLSKCQHPHEFMSSEPIVPDQDADVDVVEAPQQGSRGGESGIK